jgi:electron transfer flavoprotein alpha subunit
VRVLVLVKWVPIAAKMTFDPATRRLARAGVPGEVSAFDLRALGWAVDVVAETGGEVVVATMGPPDAAKGLRECLALGADRGVHLCDPRLAGSDTLATARALAAVVRRETPDLVLAGRSSVDAETGQVGPEVAELLGWPQVTQVRRLALDVDEARFTAERETDDGFETVEGPLPAVVTAAEDLAEERFPSKADREAAASKPIEEVGLDDLGLPATAVGITGSPTWVEDLEEVRVERRGERVEGEDASAIARSLRERLLALGAFADRHGGDVALAGGGAGAGAATWVVVEAGPRGLRRVTRELLAKADALRARLGGPVEAVVIGDDVPPEVLAAAGADRVLVARGDRLVPYDTEAHAAVLAAAIEARRPRLVLLGATARGRDLAPRVAARLGLGLTGDAIDLDVDGTGRVRQLKPAFGGTIVAPILSKTRPDLVTMRAGMLPVARPDPARRAAVETLDVPATPGRVRTLRVRPLADAVAEALDAAPVVIGVGAGLGEDGVRRVAAVAADLGIPLAATRDVTDAGWLPRQHQVGMTGRSIAPRLYLALAIRGAMEHTVGLRRAGVVVAVNTSPKAPIHRHADLSVVADATLLLPYLAALLAPPD